MCFDLIPILFLGKEYFGRSSLDIQIIYNIVYKRVKSGAYLQFIFQCLSRSVRIEQLH
jgi:hypothetical protein